MRWSAALVLPLSIALAISTTQIADAQVGVSAAAMSQAIRRAVPEDNDSQKSTRRFATVVTADGTVQTKAGARSLTVTLPGTSAEVTNERDLALNATVGHQFRTAVQDLGDGSFRALLYLSSARAPQDYAFHLETGLHATQRADGGLLVRDDRGHVVGTFAEPWARDAAGATLRTRYQVRGSAVIQTIELQPSTRFPVVADPWWIPVLILGRVLLGVITRHAARQAAARGISQAMIRQVIKNGARSRGNNNTTIYSQGKGSKRIRVIVDNRSGNVITVTKG